MSFQRTVLTIALVVLSIMLFFIALAMKGLKKSQEYPAEIAECPDYWGKVKMDVNGEEQTVCKAMGDNNTGSSTQECLYYNGSKGKLEWANECGVEWDGVTNI